MDTAVAKFATFVNVVPRMATVIDRLKNGNDLLID